ncbi:hypothetical protein [Streptomyces sp. NBC_00343]|uniref:hypothetical protein n=1 Tax=Streptomyces sp. NBC_00343 TaxID=2975719 RepID=UPI002E28EB25|nr:hypothetical protein [Streptomyces sp. NBC_00343]
MRTGADPLKTAEDNGAVFSPWHPVTLNETGQADRIREVLEPTALLPTTEGVETIKALTPDA